MTQAKGVKSRIVIDTEDSYGATPGAPAGKVLPFNSANLAADQTLIQPGTITGTRNPAQPGRGNVTVEGDITVPMDLRAMGHWLRAMFGAPDTSGAGDPYTHVYKVGDDQPSLVIEKGFQDIGKYEIFNGVKVNSFRCTFGDGNSELVATLGLMGATGDIGDAALDADPEAVSMERINNFQAAVKEDGVTMTTCTGGEISLEMGLDGDQYVLGNNGARGDLPEGVLAITGKITALFTDAALLDKAKAGTETSLELVFTSGSHSLSFELPEIIFKPASPAIEGPKGIVQTLEFNGYYQDDAAASAVIVTLTNAIATYA